MFGMMAFLLGFAVFQIVTVASLTSSDDCAQTLSGHFSKLYNLTPKQPVMFYWYINCSFYVANSKLSNGLSGSDQLENNFLSPLLNVMQKTCQGGDEILSCATKCVPYEPTKIVPKKLWKSAMIYHSEVRVTCGWLRGCPENEECFQVCADFNTDALEVALKLADDNCEPISPNNEQEAFANVKDLTETVATTNVNAESTIDDTTKHDISEVPTTHGVTTATVEDVNEGDVTSPIVEDANEGDVSSAIVEDANEGDVTNPIVEDANEEDVTSPVVEDAKEGDVTSPIVEDANYGIVTNPIVEDANEEDITSAVVENANEEDVTSPVVEDANEEDVTSPVVEDANEEDVTSPVVEDANEEDVTSPVVEDAKEGDVTSPIVEDANDGIVTNPIAEDANEEDVTSPVVEDANEEDVTSPVVEDANEEDLTSPIVEDANEGDVTSPIVEDANEGYDNSPIVEDATKVPISTLEDAIAKDETKPKKADLSKSTIKSAKSEVFQSRSSSSFLGACFMASFVCSFIVFMKQQ